MCWKIKSVVLFFTLTNTEKQILLLFFTATFPDLYLAGWIMSICRGYSLVKGEMEKVQKNKARVGGRNKLYFRRLFFFFLKSTS